MSGTDHTGRRATSADVARESGVSRATVSYVLNDTPNKQISLKTRELVIETARRLGHVPNPQAKALKTGSSNIVLCIVPALTLGFVFDRSLDSLTRELGSRGFTLLVHRAADRLDAPTVRDLWAYLTPKLVVTIGGLPPSETELLERHAPAAVVSDYGIVEHHRIGRLQAEHLISTGHRSLGYVMPADPALRAYALDRLAGVREACADALIAAPEVATVHDDLQSSRAAVAHLRNAGVTGACCHNDDVALMILEALRASGGAAPQDLAVIGSDDVPLAQLELTTVALLADAVAARITKRVLDRLGVADEPHEAGEILRLVRRTSA
ncbi:LacI family DNA-binding transcriptional regulator [Microbacterium sp. SSM24]|uniref:LacI family DNA-binding transcriptional regulator n=1 Tax=Microbacterium sp. SSM24 TaxID=2991714 RepID=UPI0022270409|nr:LacI family DNA-binding transcriptional regulator [Microbacterium sp. SSM24]MCW3492639.1 LacI family transcriptional regulator [Microbacterium sp. SSM24]